MREKLAEIQMVGKKFELERKWKWKQLPNADDKRNNQKRRVRDKKIHIYSIQSGWNLKKAKLLTGTDFRFKEWGEGIKETLEK